MKKKLLLSFAVFATALSVNAQKRMGKDYSNAQRVNNVYALPQDENVSAISKKGEVTIDLSKKRGAVVVTDTMCIASAKWSIAASQAQVYKINLTEDAAKNELTVVSSSQSFPFVGGSTLKGFGLYAKGLNPSGKTKIDVAIVDGTGFIDQETIEVTNSASFATAFYKFSKSFTLKDTFKLIISSNGLADSLKIITSGNVSKLGVNSFNGLMGVMILDVANQFAIKSNKNYAIAGDATGGKDADWQIYPIVDYSFENKTTANKYCLDADKTVTFSFSGNENLLKNPIVNLNSFFIKYSGQNKTQKRLLASAMYDDNKADTLDNLTGAFSFVKTFADEKNRKVKVSEVLRVWGYAKSYTYTSSTDLSIGLDAVATVTDAKCSGEKVKVEIKANGTGTLTGIVTEEVAAIAGEKMYEVKDANACKVIAIAVIKDAPTKLAATALVSSAIKCNGGDAEVTVSATGGTAAYTGTGVKQAVKAGNASYDVTDANGCKETATINVTEPTTLTVVASEVSKASNDNTKDGKAKVEATGGTSPYTYVWSANAGSTSEVTVGKGNYSVVVTDNNGCVKDGAVVITAGTASISELAIEGLSIYPNPTSTNLTVAFSSKGSASIELVNVAGQVVDTKNTTGVSNTSFDMTSLETGVYFVNIKVAEGTAIFKVVKD